MSKKRVDSCWVPSIFILVVILSSCSPFVLCQDNGDYSGTDDPAVLPLLTNLLYNQMSNLTVVFGAEISKQLGFCIRNPETDLNGAFNFSSNTEFLSNCLKTTKGDATRRLCTAAEMKFYFNSFFKKGSQGPNYLQLNKNCNLTSWVSGCEPGWACSVGSDQKVDLKNSKDMPSRAVNCKPCCEGFFCPHGITCMISCPLGAYCPLAELNKTTGICDPYQYQLPPGQPNHTCGAADAWADVSSSSDVFCPAGSYCPSTTQKIPCSSGHYCRMGSTSERRCFRLTACDPNTANQNLHAYGVMLIVGLSTLLLIIYNCSDQVLTTRERRLAKSREAAARSARQTARARERWKFARDVAKKHAIGLQSQLSNTFSRKKSMKQPEPLMVLDQAKPEIDQALLPSVAEIDESLLLSVAPGPSQPTSTSSKGKKKEPSNLTKMMHAPENTESNEAFNLEIGDNNNKRNAPKGKQINTQTQIFKYAYSQIEKEKALQQQNKNLTFSGVISMATKNTTRTRPAIEVSFKDLTITLKGKHKNLLRCVTGNIMPGRVSAVMGPSGAGKTTFLSALVGKVSGCTMTGSILINGKLESLRSYKKIIGFVPQDDIVHGNLTVEENLWFSARCRLSNDMPIPDKVLVVERVIESLGLQTVRDSLVGTVEKRGISGGQRKRVNVGLEMVMEPSLLILDEPTSGLDSSSSQLLLRALRREAFEGVNICMVVHQPSYGLFQMFDDLILLAKGGLTVYHGPVDKVEEYFAGLGFHVPDHVNPPDYFIDILEGIVKPKTSSGVNYSQLPIRWMLYNGYPIPPDMCHSLDGIEMSSATASPSNGIDPATSGSGQSFAGDLWQDVKCTVELEKDHIQHNFLKSKDLSNRITPGVFLQYRYYIGRVLKQWLREARIQAVDYLTLLVVGACLGRLAKVSDETFGALGYTYTVIAVSLLCKIAALRSFSQDKLQYWRESSAGISSLAYFASKDTIGLFNTLIKPLVYLSMFYFFNNPRSSFTDNYIVLVCLVYCVTGIAYVFAILLEQGSAQLWSVVLPVVLTLIGTQQKNNGAVVQTLAKLCYTKWALEAFVIANAERYSGVWLITRCGSLMASGYDVNDWNQCLILLGVTGTVSRAAALFCLVTFKKK